MKPVYCNSNPQQTNEPNVGAPVTLQESVKEHTMTYLLVANNSKNEPLAISSPQAGAMSRCSTLECLWYAVNKAVPAPRNERPVLACTIRMDGLHVWSSYHIQSLPHSSKNAACSLLCDSSALY
jgi:hypothetical protein